MAIMEKSIPGFGAAGVWQLNPEMFTEVDFEPPPQMNDVVLQIREHKHPARVSLNSRSENSVEVPRDRPTTGSQTEPHNMSSEEPQAGHQVLLVWMIFYRIRSLSKRPIRRKIGRIL
jgi:hypothetical protein